MKCFYHEQRDAVALCKSCHRGLCPDCVSDVPPGVACREKCEDEVRAVNCMLEQGKRSFRANRKLLRSAAVVPFVFGVVFLGWGGVLIKDSNNGSAIVPLGIGILMLFWAITTFRNARNFSDNTEGE